VSTLNKYVKLARQLFPTGRAFRMYSESNNERLHSALAVSEARLYEDAKSTLLSIIPDNNSFTEEDATDWERRLGLTSSSLVPLQDRKAAILRKMASPGVNPARSAAKWLEYQLQEAGFNVYVYENIIPTYPTGYERIHPGEFNASILSDLEFGGPEYGEIEYGGYYNYIVANSVYNDGDVGNFNGISDYACSFFIGGSAFGTYANVLATREAEFRQLILSQKQSQNIAFCYINFI